MKLARSQRRALCVLAGFAAIQAAPAWATDDKSTVTSVMELVGVSSDEGVGKIDYSERPKLVLPPSRGDLPPPREGASRPGDWPSEIATERRRNTDRYARVPNAPPEEKKKGLLERIRGPRPAAAPGTDDEPGLLQRALSAGRGSNEPVMDEPGRRMLTEPPQGYRRPTQDLNKYRSAGGAKSWWNPMSWVGGGGGSDNDPVAQTAGTSTGGIAPPVSQGGGGLSSLVPSFLRGSDKN